MGNGASTPARSLKARAIQWLAQREHSRVELRRKLLPLALAEHVVWAGADTGIDADPESANAAAVEQVEALLDWLEANRYLSTQRFAESRIHARAGRFGNLRIRQELAQHQVVLSADAEAALKDTELQRARAVWIARFASGRASAGERAKQARFLAGRGFSGDVIRRLLREVERGDADEPLPAQAGTD